jgi:hypothetical protein
MSSSWLKDAYCGFLAVDATVARKKSGVFNIKWFLKKLLPKTAIGELALAAFCLSCSHFGNCRQCLLM